jgi:transcriptional regulator with XRE-family HTH domain
MHFGQLLRGHRLTAGWTQEELAERSGVSAHAISVLESGRRRPRLSSLAALAAGLGLGQTERDRLIGAATATAPHAASAAAPPVIVVVVLLAAGVASKASPRKPAR